MWPRSCTSALGERSSAVLGVRPEDLYLVGASDGAYPGSIDATVDVIEPLGDSLLLECTVGEDVIRANANPRLAV